MECYNFIIGELVDHKDQVICKGKVSIFKEEKKFTCKQFLRAFAEESDDDSSQLYWNSV